MLRTRLLFGLGLVLFLASGIALRRALPRRVAPAPVVIPAATSALAPEEEADAKRDWPPPEPPVFGPRVLTIESETQVAGEGFPAISADGREIAVLQTDAEDFSGFPIEQILFLDARTGKKLLEPVVAEHDLKEATQRARVAQANARLSRTTWQALESALFPPDDAHSEHHEVHFDDLEIAKDIESSDHVTLSGSLTGTRRVSFPPVGHGCGQVTGFDTVHVDVAHTVMLVAPLVNLGGDSCTGTLAIDQLAFVRLAPK